MVEMWNQIGECWIPIFLRALSDWDWELLLLEDSLVNMQRGGDTSRGCNAIESKEDENFIVNAIESKKGWLGMLLAPG